MAIELGKRVGFRAAADALQIMLDGLGIETIVPSHDAIEQWTLRLGVGLLQDTFRPGQRVLWMVDHSSQVGKERLLYFRAKGPAIYIAQPIGLGLRCN